MPWASWKFNFWPILCACIVEVNANGNLTGMLHSIRCRFPRTFMTRPMSSLLSLAILAGALSGMPATFNTYLALLIMPVACLTAGHSLELMCPRSLWSNSFGNPWHMYLSGHAMFTFRRAITYTGACSNGSIANKREVAHPCKLQVVC